MFATDMPNLSSSASVGPFAVESLISTVESTEPSVFMNMICTAPRSVPPSSSPYAPAAKSFTPSPSKSPMFATDMPNLSLSDNVGPFAVESLISTVDFTSPSAADAYGNETYNAPGIITPNIASAKIERSKIFNIS